MRTGCSIACPSCGPTVVPSCCSRRWGSSNPPKGSPAWGPPAWWEEGGEPAETFEQASPLFDPVAQPEPDFPCDRTIDW